MTYKSEESKKWGFAEVPLKTLLAHFGDNDITAINIMQTNMKGSCNDEI